MSERVERVLGDGVDDEAFRQRVRAWAAANVPAGWRDRLRGADDAAYAAFQRQWFDRLRDGGLLAAHWPAEWGGGGYSLRRQAIIAAELARAGAPQITINSVALYHAGATLLRHGTDAQRRRHLPAILAGEVWCQGFSEPNAGSDLASLQTTALRDGDAYVVNGQKIWSSYAMYASFCLLLARTDPDAPKRRGLSFLILDLSLPGVDVRPIRQATGESEFCEIFLTDVRVPVESVLGAENDGWNVAQNTLATERGVQTLDQIERLCVTRGLLARDLAARLPALDERSQGGAARQELGRLYADTEILRIVCGRMLDELERSGGAGPEASIVKILYSETLQRLADAGTRWAGPAGQVEEPLLRGAYWESGDWLVDYLASWAWTVGGGTNEILRNVLAERVLELPREPRS